MKNCNLLKDKDFLKLYSIKIYIEMFLLILGTYFAIDMFNLPTVLLRKYSFYGIGLVIVVILFFVLNRKIYSLPKMSIWNYLDVIVLSTTFATFTYECVLFIFEKNIIKLKMLVVITIITGVYNIIRLKYISMLSQNERQYEEKTNIYDLKELYNGEIKHNGQELLLLEEKDVDYDLLNRTKIINELYNSINECVNKNKFIISLTGSWGSGKTTILNIVKKQLSKQRFIIIDNFDAWKYNNEKSLFFAMFDEIMKKTDMDFSLIETKRFVNTCVNIISSNSEIDINFGSSDEEIINRIRNIINNYLIRNNKRVVFIIDNLERTNESNVLTIIKTISTILNLDRFIYILSYDEKEMKNIFEEKLRINYDYLEKVIQLPLKVPEISQNDINNICDKCVENILLYYGVNREKIIEFKPAIKLFSANIKDLRTLKRRINSIININFYNENHLNPIDSFLLELIHDENSKLYYEIKENYKYFVSEDQIAVYGYEYEEAKTYNINASQYFDNLFFDDDKKIKDKNYKYKEILQLLFPNVDKYFKTYGIPGSHVEFRNESSYIIYRDETEHIQSVLERRIYNAKFFSLYFTKQENGFIFIDNKVKEFVAFLNTEKSNNINIVKEKLLDLLVIFKDERQRYVLETLEFYINKIEKNKILLLMCLWGYENVVDDSMMFLGTNARTRLIIVCAEIIKRLSPKEILDIKDLVEHDYKSMNFVRELLYWLNPKGKYNIKKYNQETFDAIFDSYEKMLISVTNNNINIYDYKNYARHNIYCLLDKDRYKSQIKYINDKTIFMFLSDMIVNSYGTKGYGYSLDIETLEKFISIKKVDRILSKYNNTKLNDKEKFILQIYNNAKENSGTKTENAIYKEEFIDLSK